MRRFWKTYFPFAKCTFLSSLQYRFNFIMFFLGEMMYCFVLYYVWRAVFNNTPNGTINGMVFSEMVMYVFVSFITFFMMSGNITWTIGASIRDGSIAMRLIKPIRTDLSFFFEELGGMLSFMLVAVFVFVGLEIFNFKVHGSITPLHSVLFYAISVILAALVNFLFYSSIGYLAFFFKNLWGINMAVGSIVRFLSGSLVPFVLFPQVFRDVLKLLPFASMNYIPTMIYLGKMNGREIAFGLTLQAVWVILLYGLTRLIWHCAVKHLTVQGG